MTHPSKTNLEAGVAVYVAEQRRLRQRVVLSHTTVGFLEFLNAQHLKCPECGGRLERRGEYLGGEPFMIEEGIVCVDRNCGWSTGYVREAYYGESL